MPAPSLHAKALAWVRSSIGEHEIPLGSNSGPFVERCQHATSLPGTGWPWCVATWIAAWLYGAGVKLPYTGASAYGALQWYQANLPKWVVPRSMWSDAKPGAAVVFNIGSGHMGTLARKIHHGDTTITTVDGNTSDMVAERTRPILLVRGIIDPPEDTKLPVPVAKPKRFEVATSESGHKKLIYVSGANAISRKLGRILNGKGRGGITITPRKKEKP